MIKEIHYKMGGGYLTIAKLFEVLCRHSLFDFSTNFWELKEYSLFFGDKKYPIFLTSPWVGPSEGK